LLKKNQYL